MKEVLPVPALEKMEARRFRNEQQGLASLGWSDQYTPHPIFYKTESGDLALTYIGLARVYTGCLLNPELAAEVVMNVRSQQAAQKKSGGQQ